MDDEGLKTQFNKLQQQQLKKLQRKNELRGALATLNNQRVKGNVSTDNGISLRDSLWQSDEINNLELALDDGVSIDNSDAEEEGESAQIQMRELRDENGRLYKLLKEREEELKLVKRRWKDEKKELTGQNVGADGAAKTIMELSKKNRELSVEIEREKTKNSELEKQLQNAEARAMVSQNFVVSSSSSGVVSHDKETKEEDTDAKALQEKLAQSNSRVTELRVQVDNYKEELKLAHKILAKEVGEGVSIQSLLGGSSNWKGRQQQIIQLQNKVSELQMKFSNMQSPSPRFSSTSSLSSSLVSPSLGDEKYRALLKKVDLERKEVIDKQKQDIENLEKDFKKVSEKFDASKARNSVLSVELKGLKAQITTLNEKGKHDDELISTLLQEQSRLKEQISKLKKREDEKQGCVIYKANAESELVTKLQEQVNFQQEKVASLEAEIRSLSKPGSSKARNLTANRKSPLNLSCKKSAVNSDSVSSSKGESGFEEQLKEHKIQLQEARSLQRVAEVERDRLLELVQLLEKKIDETNQGNLKAKEDLIETKRQNAKLEKQVERYKNAKGAPGFAGNVRPRGSLKQPKQSSSNLEKTAEDYQFEIDELETRLGIQLDSNEALKHALDSTLKAKEKDMSFYQDMLEQTKKIFLSGLKEFKQNIEV